MEKQKERISKFSKVVHILLKVVFVVAIVWCVFEALTWVVNRYNLPYLFQFGNVNVVLPVVFTDEAALEALSGLRIITLVDIFRDVMTIIVLGFAKGVFRLLRSDGSPFRSEVVRKLRNLAIVLLCLGLVTGLTGIIAAGIVLVLSFVFDYGCSLQQESDTTL